MEKMLMGQNVVGQNVDGTKCRRTKFMWMKISTGQLINAGGFRLYFVLSAFCPVCILSHLPFVPEPKIQSRYWLHIEVNILYGNVAERRDDVSALFLVFSDGELYYVCATCGRHQLMGNKLMLRKWNDLHKSKLTNFAEKLQLAEVSFSNYLVSIH